MKNVIIKTDRFILRSLTMADVTEKYCSWLNDQAAKRYIEFAKKKNDLTMLKTYIRDRINNDDILFLGIFTNSYEHIGNIKYELVNIQESYAVIGILIGEPAWRSKGVAKETILASAAFLNENYSIKKIFWGVDRSNIAAVYAYSKVGFVEQQNPKILKKITNNSLEMVLFL